MSEIRETIIEQWELCWGDDEFTDSGVSFKKLYGETYREVREKWEKNKIKNFQWKKFFIIPIIVVLIIYTYCILLSFFEITVGQGDIASLGIDSRNAIQGGVLLFLLIMFCAIISKWIDIKKPQETWVRHSWHIHLMEKEMLLYIYGMEPYNTDDKKRVFVNRALNIWDENQQKFAKNMENEKGLMDIFDKLSK